MNMAKEGGISVSLEESDNFMTFNCNSYNDDKLELFIDDFFPKLQTNEIDETTFGNFKSVNLRNLKAKLTADPQTRLTVIRNEALFGR
jgi:secreted Zn-dependent insulinase-like peptidase